MAYKFSKRSLNNLVGVHPMLVQLMHEAIKTTPIDFVITEGVRTAKRQQELFKQGKSKCDGIKKRSNHQVKADGYGHAVDLYPYPVDLKDLERFRALAAHILKKAEELNISIEWGGNFKTLVDMPHYEIVNKYYKNIKYIE